MNLSHRHLSEWLGFFVFLATLAGASIVIFLWWNSGGRTADWHVSNIIFMENYEDRKEEGIFQVRFAQSERSVDHH
jgi:hypothetical protein